MCPTKYLTLCALIGREDDHVTEYTVLPLVNNFYTPVSIGLFVKHQHGILNLEYFKNILVLKCNIGLVETDAGLSDLSV